MNEEELLFTKDVMKRLRYANPSAFHKFMHNESNDFPPPFKVGRRNAWYPKDLDEWFDKQRAKRGVKPEEAGGV